MASLAQCPIQSHWLKASTWWTFRGIAKASVAGSSAPSLGQSFSAGQNAATFPDWDPSERWMARQNDKLQALPLQRLSPRRPMETKSPPLQHPRAIPRSFFYQCPVDILLFLTDLMR